MIRSIHARAAAAVRRLSTKPYYVTTPIYYVNAEPHIGHLHSNVLADVLARYAALRHSGPAQLATGTDEHGMKIQRTAEARGEDPRALCDRVSGRFRALADKCGMAYTHFTRTTDARHVAAVTHFWDTLARNGFLYVGRHEGWYAVSDEAFYPESQVRRVELPSGEVVHEAVESGHRVEWMAEDNYKFRMAALRAPLLAWLERSPDVIQPRALYEHVLAEVRAGLADLSVSRPRARLHWGVPVPGDPAHTIYVWVDALVNYLTAAGYPDVGGGAWPADVHVVGKDIIRFHAVYWPALLLAAGLPLPRQLIAHGHWTVERAKMSKSRGNSVDPFAAIDTFGVDAVRFFLMRVGANVPADADYSAVHLAEFQRKFLQGQLGNLLSRVLAPKIQARLHPLARDGVLPAAAPSALHDALRALPGAFDMHMRRYEIARALAAAFDVIGAANERVQHAAPWAADTPVHVVHAAVYDTVETLRIVGVLLAPFMPVPMARLLDLVGAAPHERTWAALGGLRTHIPLRTAPGKIAPLFPRVAA